MPYSRSQSHRRTRQRNRNKLRRWLVINLILLAAVIAAAVWVWSELRGDENRGTVDKPRTETAPPAESQATSPAAPTESSAAVPSPLASPTPEETGDRSGSVTFAFVGDILPAARVAELMDKYGYDYPYREARSLLEAADLTAGNLETSITTRGDPAQNKQYLFRGPAEALPAIKDAGFDVLSLANNHSLDYGWVGLRDTMDALDDIQLPHVGAGADAAEAYTPRYLERNGLTVGFIGVTRVVPETDWKAGTNHPGLAEAYDPTKVIAAIREAKGNADLVVVLVHWGIEKAERPDDKQKTLGHAFVDAGADLVIGSHPHVLQGFEAYKGKWIAYSLGNFVFSTTGNPKTSETGFSRRNARPTASASLRLTRCFPSNRSLRRWNRRRLRKY
ncbi:CapA family protein [Cohnella faecalis]|uniref:CapA family protein n=1 Tax=Cohnella faecalis TaxID=2315694 RepID=UPI001F1C26B0|nr:CapA family protein [Cohnella faecalis]